MNGGKVLSEDERRLRHDDNASWKLSAPKRKICNIIHHEKSQHFVHVIIVISIEQLLKYVQLLLLPIDGRGTIMIYSHFLK